MIGYNIAINKRTQFLRSQRSRVEGERNARGKSLVKCLCVCELKMDVRVFEFEMK